MLNSMTLIVEGNGKDGISDDDAADVGRLRQHQTHLRVRSTYETPCHPLRFCKKGQNVKIIILLFI